MRKTLSLCVVLLLAICLPALSEDLDMSALTDAELRQIVDAASSELARRATGAEDGVPFAAGVTLLSVDGYAVTLTGNYGFDRFDEDSARLTLEVVAENNSANTLGLSIDDAAANDWVVFATTIPPISPGQKIKGELDFDMDDAGLFDFAELNTLSLHVHAYNDEDYETVGDIAATKLLFAH